MTETPTARAGSPDPTWRSDPDVRAGTAPTGDVTQTQTGLFVVGTRTAHRTQTPTAIPTATPTPTAGRGETPTEAPGPGRGRSDAPTPTAQTDPTAQTGLNLAAKIATDAGRGRGRSDAQTPTNQTDPTGRPTGWIASFKGWLARGGYVSALTAVVSVVAALGQMTFAKAEGFVNMIKIGRYDLTPYLAPAVFDLAVAALMHGGLRAARNRHSPWPWWIGASGVAVFSIVVNFNHEGGTVTGGASSVLFLTWALYLHTEYKDIVRRRETEDSNAEDMLSTDMLFTVKPKLARQAWVIARTKQMAEALAYRHAEGETMLSRRDVAIRAAQIYLDVYADQLWTLTHPAAPGQDQQADRPKKKVRWWSFGLLRRAKWIADLTAWNAVDNYLGIPLLDRTGIKTARITYAQPEPPVVRPRPIASAAAPAAPELPAAPKRNRRALPAAPAGSRPGGSAADLPGDEPDLPDETDTDTAANDDETIMVIVPKGMAAANWVDLAKIAGLPELDPELSCECHQDSTKRCGRSLVEHVQRRGKQVAAIIGAVPDWATREERIGKNVVFTATGVRGSQAQNEIAGVFDQLRKIARGEDTTDVIEGDLVEAPEPSVQDN